MTIPELFRQRAEAHPARIALIAPRGRRRHDKISYATLAGAVDFFTGVLRRGGIERGDRVMVLVPMSPGLYIALIALFQIGATAVFPDLSQGIRRVGVSCKSLPPKALIGGWKIGILRWLIPELRGVGLFFSEPEVRRQGPAGEITAQPEDAALVTFTSGSTGNPKAAVRTQQFLIAQYEALRDSIRLQEGEVDLATLPVFVLANLAAGLTSLIPNADISRPGFVRAGPVARQIFEFQPTRAAGSPAFFERLADAGVYLGGFRKIYTGGAPVFPRLLERLQRLCPDATVTAVYGSTEAEPMAEMAWHEIRPEDHARMAGGAGLMAGRPVSALELRVIQDQWGTPLAECSADHFAELTMPREAIGEIVVSGGHVLPGYLGGEGDAETKIRVGDAIWHRTGDAGRIDSEGRLWLLGRCGAKTVIGGKTIYPLQLECPAMTHDWVRRCALVGRRLMVECEREPGDEAWSGLSSRCGEHGIEAVRIEKIPVDRRHNAKIDYPALKKILAG